MVAGIAGENGRRRHHELYQHQRLNDHHHSRAGTSTVVPAGFLALPTNSGSPYHRNDFAMVPELGATLGLDLTARLRLTAGYSLIYWSKVVRAGDQVDINVNHPAIGRDLDRNSQPPLPLRLHRLLGAGFERRAGIQVLRTDRTTTSSRRFAVAQARFGIASKRRRR